MEQTLYHHGIKGQKWGVRRYQNYDGSYTQAGIRRYNTSLEKYNQASDAYKTVKALKKNGVSTTSDGRQFIVSDSLVKEAKLNKKAAKRQLNKDYKHLKQDKLADKGKALYGNGKTITGNSQVTTALETIGGISLAAAKYTQGQVAPNITKALIGVGAASIAGAETKRGVDAYQARQLRAYYGHTSNY